MKTVGGLAGAYYRWATGLGRLWLTGLALAGPPVLLLMAIAGAASGGSGSPTDFLGTPPVTSSEHPTATTGAPSTMTAATPLVAPATAIPSQRPPTEVVPTAVKRTEPSPIAVPPTEAPPTRPPPTQVAPTQSPPTQPPPTARPPTPVSTAAPASQYLPGDAYNCSDFATFAQAKAYFDAVPGDPSKLDADHDGIPCESLPGAPKS